MTVAEIEVPQHDAEAVPAADAADALEGLRGARFGRSRFLTMVGTMLFGTVAYHVVKANPAYAHTDVTARCCGPSKQCTCCTGNSCCGGKGCRLRSGECPSGGSSWNCCQAGVLYNCKDWWDWDNHRCICPGAVGSC